MFNVIFTVIRCGFANNRFSASEDDGSLSASVELTADSGVPLSEFVALVSTAGGSAVGKFW